MMENLKLEEFLFQSYTLSFDVPYTDPQYKTLVEDGPLEFEGEHFIITSIEDMHDEEGKAYRSVEAAAWWVALGDILRPGDYFVNDATVLEGLNLILSDTGWTVDQVTGDTETYTIEAVDASVLGLLWQWAKVTGNEIYFHPDNKMINFVPSIGVDVGLSFRYSRNMRSIKRTSTPPRATRFYAIGQDSLDIGPSSPDGRAYIEDYSYYIGQGLTLEQARELHRRDKILSDDSFTDPRALYQWAVSQAAILAQPEVIYSASVVDLTRVTGKLDPSYACGDTVYVYDEILGLSLTARVTRRIIFPDEPERNAVELSFGLVEMPNPNARSQRSAASQSWELFESKNDLSPLVVRQLNMVLGRMLLRVMEGAEWLLGYTLVGVGSGSASTITVEFVDEATGQHVHPALIFDTSEGQEFRHSFTISEKDLSIGIRQLTVRAISDTSAGGINIEINQSNFWVLARKVARTTITYPNSMLFSASFAQNGAVQQFTFPEFVSEVRIDCVAGASTGAGGRVSGTIFGSPGTVLDIYVGNAGYTSESSASAAPGGAWPDGGRMGSKTSVQPQDTTYHGAGSSQVRPAGGEKIDAYIVAPAGGGRGHHGTGGAGGFFQGDDGGVNGALPGVIGGGGATQNEGGTAGYWVGEFASATAGAFAGGGGDSPNRGSLYWHGGGGGGGWYGGGGGHSPGSPGTDGGGGGGGGGSGWVGGGVHDIEIEDGFNPPYAAGYVRVSWPDPDPSLALYS